MNIMKRTLAALLSCSILAAPCSVCAEESVEKNFKYYLTLSDEEVFKEYCATYGYDYDYWVSEGEMPESDYAWMFFEIEYTSDIVITDNTYYEWVENPEILGFPADWYVEEIMTTEYEFEDGSGGAEGISAKVCFDNFDIGNSTGNPEEMFVFLRVDISDFLSDFDHNNIYNIYRVRLTLENSEFVQTYGNPIRYAGDNVMTAVDYVLTEGGITTPTDPIFGDINADNIVDATDAALLLEYAAAVGAGNADTLENYLASRSAAE